MISIRFYRYPIIILFLFSVASLWFATASILLENLTNILGIFGFVVISLIALVLIFLSHTVLQGIETLVKLIRFNIHQEKVATISVFPFLFLRDYKKTIIHPLLTFQNRTYSSKSFHFPVFKTRYFWGIIVLGLSIIILAIIYQSYLVIIVSLILLNRTHKLNYLFFSNPQREEYLADLLNGQGEFPKSFFKYLGDKLNHNTLEYEDLTLLTYASILKFQEEDINFKELLVDLSGYVVKSNKTILIVAYLDFLLVKIFIFNRLGRSNDCSNLRRLVIKTVDQSEFI